MATFIYFNLLVLVGNRDGRTQSARACKPALLHLALRTLGFRTSVFGSEDLGFRTSKKDTGFHSQDLGFRTSINGHWVSLSGPGFQDLESSPSYGRLIFFPSLFSASTVTFLPRPVFPSLFSASTVTFLPRPVFPSLFSASVRPSVRPGRFRHRKC